MPVFELYNADGSLQLDLSSRITKLLGSLEISQAGSFYSEGFSKGTLFYLFSPSRFGFANWTRYPTITLSGNTLSWTAPEAPCIFIFGVY